MFPLTLVADPSHRPPHLCARGPQVPAAVDTMDTSNPKALSCGATLQGSNHESTEPKAGILALAISAPDTSARDGLFQLELDQDQFEGQDDQFVLETSHHVQFSGEPGNSTLAARLAAADLRASGQGVAHHGKARPTHRARRHLSLPQGPAWRCQQ